MDRAKGNQIGGRDFPRIGRERGIRRSPDHEGSDAESRARLEIVQSPEEVLRADVEPDFLVELSKGGFGSALAGLDAAAWKGPLASVMAKPRRSPRENEGGFSFVVSDDDRDDRRGSEAFFGHLSSRKSLEVGLESLAKLPGVPKRLHSPIMVASAPGGTPFESQEVPLKRFLSVLIVFAVVAAPSVALAHPHFNKTITVALPGGAEATIVYNTTPANEANAESAKVGEFITPRRPSLKLSAEVKAGAVTIPAGEYTIGVIKNSPSDWTMALYKGGLARGATPEMANVIKLESNYTANAGNAPHMLIDITPGKGKFEGKAVLTLHFGNLFLEGVLS
jgi:hypothetical protein